jgi:hypothetical protein
MAQAGKPTGPCFLDCFLNAAKALLTVKGVDFSDYHGVSGKFDPISKRALSNERITFKGVGILPALSKYLQEEETTDEHTLKDVLSNLPFSIVLFVIPVDHISNFSFQCATFHIARETATTFGSPQKLTAALLMEEA